MAGLPLQEMEASVLMMLQVAALCELSHLRRPRSITLRVMTVKAKATMTMTRTRFLSNADSDYDHNTNNDNKLLPPLRVMALERWMSEDSLDS